MKRRLFLFAAPAIVAAPSLMKVSAAVLSRQPIITRVRYPWREISAGSFTSEEIAMINNAALAYYMERDDFIYARTKGHLYVTDADRLIVKQRLQDNGLAFGL